MIPNSCFLLISYSFHWNKVHHKKNKHLIAFAEPRPNLFLGQANATICTIENYIAVQHKTIKFSALRKNK
jgi:hypothetical protein